MSKRLADSALVTDILTSAFTILIKRSVNSSGGCIYTYHFPSKITQGESLVQEILSERVGLSESTERFQRRLVEDALRECGGNRTQAARMLRMHRANFVRLMRRFGIE